MTSRPVKWKTTTATSSLTIAVICGVRLVQKCERASRTCPQKIKGLVWILSGAVWGQTGVLAWKLSDVRLWMRTAANHNLAIYHAGGLRVNCLLYLEYYHFTTLPDSCTALFKKVARNGSCLFNRVILWFLVFYPDLSPGGKVGSWCFCKPQKFHHVCDLQEHTLQTFNHVWIIPLKQVNK